MTYTPTSEDVGWAQKVLGLTRDGGRVALPGWLLVYRVSHREHTLTLETPKQLNLPSLLTHQRMVEVFKKLGYHVTEERGGDHGC